MSFFRFLNFGTSKLIPVRNVLVTKQPLKLLIPEYQLTAKRLFNKSFGIKNRTMKLRRKIAGPEKLRRRNEWLSWNYKSELYAFSQRLNENITFETLQTAFIFESYLQEEEQKRKELDIPSQDVHLSLTSNTSLIASGHEVISNYLDYYLSYCYPKLPAEGISAIKTYLMSPEVLSHISFNLGTKDLIFSVEYPPNELTLSDTFKAIVGSIAKDDSTPRAENFILDFVCPHMIGKDVFDIWDLQDPLGLVNSILLRAGLTECEPRLIAEAGRNTIEAVYHVGLYVNKLFLGRGPGETLDTAVEMAAYDALRKMFGIRDCEKPLPFGDKARAIDFKSAKPSRVSLEEWCSDDLKVYAQQ
ncbi:hypothetical protein JTE90_023336 [Oedothorax gibbosus]|uniref:Large ribosomal subunit protein mL44 n=1 Tax=Oedothorax gibbosus TaxID=931172 RepID=A0AAV6VGV4_9ARAC|nr:hypothetical protein JTE90_023336 [Oedothorax gibbosus]